MSIKDIILKLYFIVRLPVIMALSIIFNSRKKPHVSKSPRILVIRLDRMGDLVLTIPVMENIKLYYPDSRISILVRPYLYGLAKLIRSVDEIIVYKGFAGTVQELRRSHFDISIDMLCDYRLKPAFLSLMSGAPERIGFDGGFREKLFTDVVEYAPSGRSMAEINLDIVRSLGMPVRVHAPRIALERPQKKEKGIVVVHPGGHYQSQRWPSENFAKIARKITEAYDVEVVIALGPNERDLVQGITDKLKGKHIETVFSDMEGLAFLIARAYLLVCNNSGPLHLAAALGIPTVSTMGPTDPDLWWPQGDNHIVIRKDLACSPCSRGICKKHECMTTITVEEVFEKAQNVLDKVDAIKKHK